MRRRKAHSRFYRPVLYLLLAVLLITAAAAAFYQPHTAASEEEAPPTASAVPPTEAVPIPAAGGSVPVKEGTALQAEGKPGEPASMEGTLFIGDSRTIGLLEYAGIEGATFFATIGMNVYKADTEEVSVPGVGKLTLPSLLDSRQFTRVYVMLGINELGYPLSSTLKKYGELIGSIQAAQPEALIFLQANLHVTKERSERDEVINNPKIDALNGAIAQLADQSRVFYLDANCMFDDADGALSEEKSGDSAHPLGRYYREWGAWIAAQTDEILANQ